MIAAELLLAGVLGSATVGGILAVTETEPNMSLAPLIAGGGATAILATALVEVARRLLNGRLIPREVRDYEQEMGAAIQAAGQREDTLLREASEMRRVMEDVRDEMRQLRRMQQGG